MSRPVLVGLVGLGLISETHLAVLAGDDRVELAFTADPVTGPVEVRGVAPAHYRSMSDALASHDVDLVVIATPTPTHASLAAEALARSSARLLVEKPLVHDITTLDRLRASATAVDLEHRVMVAHHFAFSPEVRWAADLVAAHADWGPITTITCAFHDPYILRGTQAFESYVSSWMDSGVNQLSMLTRFVDVDSLTSRHEDAGGVSAWCTANYRHRDGNGVARLRTSWLTGTSSKRSALALAEANVEVWIDHTAMTAIAMRGNELLAAHDDDGRVPRKIAHYQPLYDAVLTGAPDRALSFRTAELVTKLLHAQP